MAEIYSLHRLKLAPDGQPLFAAIAAAIPGLSRVKAREAIMGGLVKVSGRVVTEAKTILDDAHAVEVDLRHGVKTALRARIHNDVAVPTQPFTIVHVDSDVLIVNKSPGIVSAPQGGRGLAEKPERGHLPELVRRAFRRQGRELEFLGVVHRLDKETSGCLIFGLTRDAQRSLSAQFAEHAAGRTYRAITMGQPRKDSDTLTGKLGRGDDGKRAVVEDDEDGKEAVTHFTVRQRVAQGAELDVTLETGRTHQIRVMLSDIACPIYGDHVYGWKPRPGQVIPRSPRLMLHAWKLAFDHPRTGKRVEVEAPIPESFSEFLQVLAQPAPEMPIPPAAGELGGPPLSRQREPYQSERPPRARPASRPRR